MSNMDDLMQLVALAKNDEQYFKRIEGLKQMQMELAQYKEIADTVKEADMHLARARQRAQEVVEQAEQEGNALRKSAIEYVEEQKRLIEQHKQLKADLKEKKQAMDVAIAEARAATVSSEKIDKERREMTELRNKEIAETLRIRKHYEEKFTEIKRIINF